jgi:hypothetical protein
LDAGVIAAAERVGYIVGRNNDESWTIGRAQAALTDVESQSAEVDAFNVLEDDACASLAGGWDVVGQQQPLIGWIAGAAGRNTDAIDPKSNDGGRVTWIEDLRVGYGFVFILLASTITFTTAPDDERDRYRDTGCTGCRNLYLGGVGACGKAGRIRRNADRTRCCSAGRLHDKPSRRTAGCITHSRATAGDGDVLGSSSCSASLDRERQSC